MVDIPPTPLEKLLGYRIQCVALGKEYKENVVRAVINAGWEEKGGHPSQLLPMVDDPEYMPVNPQRARAVRMDDREAIKEVEAAQAQAAARLSNRDNVAIEVQLKDARIAELEAQLAAAREDPPAAPQQPAAPQASAASTTTVAAPDGKPSVDWGKSDLLAYAQARGVEVKNPNFASKASIVEAILEKEAEAEAAAAAATPPTQPE